MSAKASFESYEDLMFSLPLMNYIEAKKDFILKTTTEEFRAMFGPRKFCHFIYSVLLIKPLMYSVDRTCPCFSTIW